MAPSSSLRLFIMALAFPLGDAWALDYNRSIGQHSLDRWSTADGLPRNTVNAAVQTEEGLLWFATSEGLARFEGTRFRSWSQADFPSVPTLNATALVADDEPGVLWVGTAGGGLLRFDYHTDGHLLLTEEDGLCGDNVQSLAVDSNGGLWIGTNRALACR